MRPITKHFGLKMPMDLYHRLKNYKIENDVPMKDFIYEAIKQHLDLKEKKNED